MRSMADLATLQTRLSEAETAYHALMTGAKKASVGLGDMQVTYARADAGRLASYIAQLKTEIAVAGGSVSGQRRRAFVVDL